MSDATTTVFRGLEGVLMGTTKIATVDGEKGQLTYRGYDIHELAAQSTFEETAWLLLRGELPTQSELATFSADLSAARAVSADVMAIVRGLPKQAHPMALLRTAISAYGCTDPREAESGADNLTRIGTQLIAQIGTLTAAIWRLSQGQEPVAPDASLSYAANFLYMLFGTKPTADLARMMDISLICHADHEIPASTFSALVVGSSLTDLYSSIAAAIGSLKGPLHGGANEQVLRNLDSIGSAANVPAYMDKVRADKLKVPGIGHRVYKTYDPRAVIFKPLADKMAEAVPAIRNTYDTAVALEAACVEHFGPKKLYPNVDYYSGVIYRAMNIDPIMYTPIFAVSRMVGWVAHCIEHLEQNRIFRPEALYEGSAVRAYVPAARR